MISLKTLYAHMNAVKVHMHIVTVNESLRKILSIMGLEKERIAGKKISEQKTK